MKLFNQPIDQPAVLPVVMTAILHVRPFRPPTCGHSTLLPMANPEFSKRAGRLQAKLKNATETGIVDKNISGYDGEALNIRLGVEPKGCAVSLI